MRIYSGDVSTCEGDERNLSVPKSAAACVRVSQGLLKGAHMMKKEAAVVHRAFPQLPVYIGRFAAHGALVAA